MLKGIIVLRLMHCIKFVALIRIILMHAITILRMINVCMRTFSTFWFGVDWHPFPYIGRDQRGSGSGLGRLSSPCLTAIAEFFALLSAHMTAMRLYVLSCYNFHL